jgi:hypothetical protein
VNIRVRIDRVVLDGVSGDPRAIEQALHAELSRLVLASPRSTWQESRRQRRVEAPRVSAGPAGSLGRGIARSIHSGLVGGRTP